jgi:predicted aspartyl protease
VHRGSFAWAIIAATLGVAAACSPSANTPPKPPNGTASTSADGGTSGPPVAADTTLRKVAIDFTIQGRPFPLPLVKASVAGTDTLALLDTGANSTVIAGWLARKTNLTLQRFGDTGTDHTGRSIETRRALHPQAAIDGWGSLPDEPLLVTDVPDAVTKLGIGMFISPQKLVVDGESIVLDFPHKEMRAVKRGTELGTLGSALTLDPVALCEDKDSPIQGLAYVLRGTIDGEAVKLLVDTGAHHSDLLMSSPPGVKLLPRAVDSKEQVYAASGKVTPKTLKDVKVSVGAVEASYDVDLIPGKKDEFCPRDGVLAMDVLMKCELLLEPGKLVGQCR